MKKSLPFNQNRSEFLLISLFIKKNLPAFLKQLPLRHKIKIQTWQIQKI